MGQGREKMRRVGSKKKGTKRKPGGAQVKRRLKKRTMRDYYGDGRASRERDRN
jgi:hypothetical protein